jgi:hypothetical protein
MDRWTINILKPKYGEKNGSVIGYELIAGETEEQGLDPNL